MKKLILLLFIPLVFACSSDDEDNNSNETFLEKYDGVVWEINEDTTVYLRFNNDTLNWLTSYEFNEVNEYECFNLISDNPSVNFLILINSGDNFSYSAQYPDEDAGDVYITVSDNGNILEIVNPSHNSQATFLKSDLTEIPCD